jgi:hypothetical protein
VTSPFYVTNAIFAPWTRVYNMYLCYDGSGIRFASSLSLGPECAFIKFTTIPRKMYKRHGTRARAPVSCHIRILYYTCIHIAVSTVIVMK